MQGKFSKKRNFFLNFCIQAGNNWIICDLKLYSIPKNGNGAADAICHGERILLPGAVVEISVQTEDSGEGGDVVRVQLTPVLVGAAVEDVAKAGTVIEAARGDGGHGGRDADGLQCPAEGEGIVADELHAVGEEESPQSGAAGEGHGTDDGDGVGQDDGCQFLTSGEAAHTDGVDGLAADGIGNAQDRGAVPVVPQEHEGSVSHGEAALVCCGGQGFAAPVIVRAILKEAGLGDDHIEIDSDIADRPEDQKDQKDNDGNDQCQGAAAASGSPGFIGRRIGDGGYR